MLPYSGTAVLGKCGLVIPTKHSPTAGTQVTLKRCYNFEVPIGTTEANLKQICENCPVVTQEEEE